ncbi:hypothetical protein J6590_038185 [Homalodisca vitripennis]|nr:hypothetical protein J6590_038185 [Homalodisca vitripennis]
MRTNEAEKEALNDQRTSNDLPREKVTSTRELFHRAGSAMLNNETISFHISLSFYRYFLSPQGVKEAVNLAHSHFKYTI